MKQRTLIINGSQFAAGNLALGAALGAGLMYLFDPVSGRRRRGLVRDRTVHLTHATSDGARKAAVDLAHRLEGIAATARSKLRPAAEASDEVLVERVRSKLGVVVSHPHALHVTAHGGTVTLSGPILRHEAKRALRCAARIRSVDDVIDQLERHETAGDVPSLQGGMARGRRPELLQENWAPSVRWIAGSVGISLIAGGLKSKSALGLLVSTLGTVVLLRSVTNLPMKRLYGVGGGRRAIEIDKAIHIDAPPEELFAFFYNFENLPQFMSHLESVTVDGERSHWVARGPAGLRASWDAEITGMEPNHLLAWRSLPGSMVKSAGVVRFEPDPRGGTLLSVHMTYNPPAGAVGHAIASLFGADAKHALHDDLLRLKSLVENGKASGNGRQVRREDLWMHKLD